MAPFLTLKTFHIPHLRKSCQYTKTQDLTRSPKPSWKFLHEENWSTWENYPLSAIEEWRMCCLEMELRRAISSVQFSCSVVSDSLQPHGLQHTRPPCPSPTPRACSNSCPSSQWCHLTISSSVVPFSYHLQSFPASGSFQMSQFFASGGQSLTFSISPSNEYSGLISFRIDWLDLLEVQGTLKILLQHHSSKASILQHSAFLIQKGHRSCLFSPGDIQHLLYISSSFS